MFVQQSKIATSVFEVVADAPRDLSTDRSMPVRALGWSLMGDCAVAFAAVLFSFWLRFETGINRVKSLARSFTLHDYSHHIIFGTIALLFVLAFLRVYERQNLLRYRRVSLLIVKGCGMWVMAFMGLDLMFHFQPSISRLFVGIAGGSAMFGLLSWSTCFTASSIVRRSPSICASAS